MPPYKIFVIAFKNNSIILNVNYLHCNYTLFFDIFQQILCFLKFHHKINFIIIITIAPGIPKTPTNIDVIKFNPI